MSLYIDDYTTLGAAEIRILELLRALSVEIAADLANKVALVDLIANHLLLKRRLEVTSSDEIVFADYCICRRRNPKKVDIWYLLAVPVPKTNVLGKTICRRALLVSKNFLLATIDRLSSFGSPMDSDIFPVFARRFNAEERKWEIVDCLGVPALYGIRAWRVLRGSLRDARIELVPQPETAASLPDFWFWQAVADQQGGRARAT